MLTATCLTAIVLSEWGTGRGAFAAKDPQGAVLTYEVDPARLRGGEKVNMGRLAEVVDRRLNSGREAVALVRKLDDRLLEVALLRTGDADRQRAERLLAREGTLEFRILADKRDDSPTGDVIEQALANSTKTRVVDANGKLVGWWVPVRPGDEPNFAGDAYAGVIRRQKAVRGRSRSEVLVLNDIYNVTAVYISRAEVANYRGRPSISVTFNSTGGKLFSEMTNWHLPRRSGGFTYKLGVIIDGELYSAPAIQGVVFANAQLTGSFSQQEAEDIARIELRPSAGANPARQEE